MPFYLPLGSQFMQAGQMIREGQGPGTVRQGGLMVRASGASDVHRCLSLLKTFNHSYSSFDQKSPSLLPGNVSRKLRRVELVAQKLQCVEDSPKKPLKTMQISDPPLTPRHESVTRNPHFVQGP